MAYINGNKSPVILRKGDNAFIRYSANADGTDFTEEWSEGQNYIGFATGQTAPTNKNDYEWISLPSGLSDVELPQEWFDINEAYEAIKEDDHKLLGGVIYKDFEGNIRVFPLAPPYGIRTDEVGEEYAQSSIAMYNSKQQLMAKPATDGRHTVPLSQLLDELKKYLPTSGGTMTGKPIIKTSNPSVNLMDTTDGNTIAYVQAYKGKVYFGYSAAKSLSVDKEGNVNIPKGLEFTSSDVFGGEVNPVSPVDTSNPDVNSRSPYLFCRDSENIFSKKVYAIHTQGRTIVERDENGEIRCSTPIDPSHAVNLEYLNERLANFSGGGGSGENTEAAQKAAEEAKAAATTANNALSLAETARSEAEVAASEARAIKDSLKKETWTFTLDDGTVVTKVVCVDVGA